MRTTNQGSTQFLNFSDALHHLRRGERIARRQWKPGAYIKIDYSHPKTSIALHAEYGMETWEPSDRMILAEDWYVLGENS